NSFNGNVQFNEKGLPVSSEKHHGIGTQSIAFIVKKYDGVLLYKIENQRFILQILLNCSLLDHTNKST
ncbi:MAG: GHKL domain-containing protein, partial [Eubacterium sp.]